MRSAGNVTWGQNGSAMLSVTYDSLTSDSQVGFSATALLNTTIREVSPLRGEISYTQSSQHIDAVFDLEVCTHKVKLRCKILGLLYLRVVIISILLIES